MLFTILRLLPFDYKPALLSLIRPILLLNCPVYILNDLKLNISSKYGVKTWSIWEGNGRSFGWLSITVNKLYSKSEYLHLTRSNAILICCYNIWFNWFWLYLLLLPSNPLSLLIVLPKFLNFIVLLMGTNTHNSNITNPTLYISCT
jgi:hypothetical protein